MSEDLEKVLTQKLSEESITGEILNLEPLTGGASKEIWKFELKTKAQTEKYILRRGSGIAIPEPLLSIYFSVCAFVFNSNFQISLEAPPVKGSRFKISPVIDSSLSF